MIGQEVVKGKAVGFTNGQRLLAAFADTSFSKNEAAGVLGITVSGAYKLLQRMTEQGLLVARKEGKQWIYSAPANQRQTDRNGRPTFPQTIKYDPPI